MPTGAPQPKDAIIEQKIAAAAEQIERDTDRIPITAKYEYAGERFPIRSGESISLPIRPIQSIDAIRYLDADGNEATMPTDDYKLDQNRRHVFLAYGATWPEHSPYQNSIRIEFTAGFGDTPDTVPSFIKEAMHLQVGRWFFDPTMEDDKDDKSYERAILKIIRASYP